MKSYRKNRHAFTIVELMMVVAMVGLLGTIALPGFVKIKQNTISARVMNDFRIFTNAFQVYNFDNGSYPEDSVLGRADRRLTALADSVTRFGRADS